MTTSVPTTRTRARTRTRTRTRTVVATTHMLAATVHVTVKKSTIDDLAEKALTPASTVSAILNGSWQSRGISSDTAQRVLKLASDCR